MINDINNLTSSLLIPNSLSIGKCQRISLFVIWIISSMKFFGTGVDKISWVRSWHWFQTSNRRDSSSSGLNWTEKLIYIMSKTKNILLIIHFQFHVLIYLPGTPKMYFHSFLNYFIITLILVLEHKIIHFGYKIL